MGPTLSILLSEEPYRNQLDMPINLSTPLTAADPNTGVRQDTLCGIPIPEPFLRHLLHSLAGVVVPLQAHMLFNTHPGTQFSLLCL